MSAARRDGPAGRLGEMRTGALDERADGGGRRPAEDGARWPPRCHGASAGKRHPHHRTDHQDRERRPFPAAPRAIVAEKRPAPSGNRCPPPRPTHDPGRLPGGAATVPGTVASGSTQGNYSAEGWKVPDFKGFRAVCLTIRAPPERPSSGRASPHRGGQTGQPAATGKPLLPRRPGAQSPQFP